MSVRLLLTAFEPFGGRVSNTSERLLQPLLAAPPEGVLARVLPVNFKSLRRAVPRLLQRHAPRTWLLLGENGDADHLRCERVAVNLLDADTPDNEGHLPRYGRAVRGAPDAYFTTLDPRRLQALLETHDIPAEVSHTAGTYACNFALYLALHHLNRQGIRSEVGFIHVPRHYRRTGHSLAELRTALSDLAEEL